MIDAIKQLQNALGYARFEDDAIKTASLRLLQELDTELTGEDYDPGSAVVEATTQLVDKIDTTDSTKEEAAGSDDSDDEDDNDPFSGLGDDEGDES